MLIPVHTQLIRQALGASFSPRNLDAIVAANIRQDALRGQFGHDEYHFDNNAFAQSRAYLDEQRALTLSSLRSGDAASALSAFGRLTHTAQDFYAHTNYVSQWLARFVDSPPPPAPEIDPVMEGLIASPDLSAGKLYYPLEVLYFIPPLRGFALSILPRDSHAHMNLDSAERGPHFEYAFQAALKRTRLEFEQVVVMLLPEQRNLFFGR
jgi:hypothetical protein